MHPPAEHAVPSLRIDFIGGALGFRRLSGEGRGQPLARAVGMRPGRTPAVVDATAGLGRDAFLLALLGAEITMIERVPEVAAALREALDRARAAEPDLAPVLDRMHLVMGDARALLPTLSPDVVLVDPMHPERTKSALVKAGMRELRGVVGDDPDAAELMAAALAAARERVVLKWPRKAAALPGLPAPSHQLVGRSTRYDVFMRPPRADAG